MMQKIQFDDSRARTYRKRLEVFAFRSNDPICFRKSWGEPEIRQGGWVIMPLTDDGQAMGDISVRMRTFLPEHTRLPVTAT